MERARLTLKSPFMKRLSGLLRRRETTLAPDSGSGMDGISHHSRALVMLLREQCARMRKQCGVKCMAEYCSYFTMTNFRWTDKNVQATFDKSTNSNHGNSVNKKYGDLHGHARIPIKIANKG